MMSDFQNSTAVVTGGASGIGRALCEALARRGAVVVVADINAQRAQEVATSIASQGGRAEIADGAFSARSSPATWINPPLLEWHETRSPVRDP
jgi:NAD(P)-dependent dehydrogenase (short-subunit alcohol dehydrogenase family)